MAVKPWPKIPARAYRGRRVRVIGIEGTGALDSATDVCYVCLHHI